MDKNNRMKIFCIVLFCMMVTEACLTFTSDTNITGDEVGFNIRAIQHFKKLDIQSIDNFIKTEILVKAENVNAESVLTSKLPASLQIIEDEAFEGTAMISIELPEKVEIIGDRAFANISSLQFVKISDATKVIAKNAFLGSNHVTITGAPNSYARTWAKENGVPFTAYTVLYAGTSNVQASSGIYTRQTKPDIETIIDTDENVISPQSRPVEDIKADRFDQYIANSLCTRAPPACA